MRWRVGVAVLLALAVGAAGGWAYASAQDDGDQDTGPVASAIEPVPATPSLPVTVAQPDPDDPTLKTGVRLTPTTLQLPEDGDPRYQLDLQVPVVFGAPGFDGDNKWIFTVPGNDPKAYGLRVQIIAAQAKPVSTALSVRISKLKSAQAQGNLSDLDYELSPTNDGFTATYVQDGYNRVSIEQFYAGSDGNAFATIAGYGRYRDRVGLEDLVARISIDLSTYENP